MTCELIEHTARLWVFNDPARGARELRRHRPGGSAVPPQSPEEIADALAELAGRMAVAATRLW